MAFSVMNFYSAEVYWGDGTPGENRYTGKKIAPYTMKYTYTENGCYHIIAMYGAYNYYCGCYKTWTVTLR